MNQLQILTLAKRQLERDIDAHEFKLRAAARTKPPSEYKQLLELKKYMVGQLTEIKDMIANYNFEGEK